VEKIDKESGKKRNEEDEDDREETTEGMGVWRKKKWRTMTRRERG
jgi:hypothetical protein